MIEDKNIRYESFNSTSVSTFFDSSSVSSEYSRQFCYVYSPIDGARQDDKGKYSVFEIANYYLMKQPMTNKKLQKICFYAQAWFYALKDFRLIDSDFEAWVHGPVSPALYARFKVFGFDTIVLRNHIHLSIADEDKKLLDDVWDTYGNMSGNALEALTHREEPWIEARLGYKVDENGSTPIRSETMKKYYKSIYVVVCNI